LRPQKEEEEPLQKPMPPKTEVPEREEDALLFQEKGLKEREEMEGVVPEREETEVKPAEPKEPVRRRERRGLRFFLPFSSSCFSWLLDSSISGLRWAPVENLLLFRNARSKNQTSIE